MIIFYNAGIYLYYLLILFISPFNSKAKLWIRGRKNWKEKLGGKFKTNKAPVAWFHCASLGEFEQARPVLENFRGKFPEYKILLTFFSPSGYEVRKNYPKADFIEYLPLDTHSNSKSFIEITRPKIAFFVKYEFWHHYIHCLNESGIPVISFSTIFRKDQLFFKSYGKFYLAILKSISKIFVQNKESLELLTTHQINTGEIAGDTRFDRVLEIRKSIKPLPIVESFKSNSKVFIAGSTWPKDLEILLPLINKGIKDLKFIIAPHEIHEHEINDFIQSCKLNCVRYTKADNLQLNNFEVLIIDCIGILSGVYAYGDFGYIGGAFGKGLHNTLEAATFGLPLFFGPNYKKFQEAKDLISIGGAFSITSAKEFENAFFNVMNDAVLHQEITNKNKNFIEANKGATDRIIDYSALLLN
ncbi:3-deoxy-D-manno-octulosonic acid transferase [Sporocytophaga myxococcoides]|uniref:3-deoxy-D-manno-octulosonic acid transferase n=1 Tax=Sporocytophaga myxococcoides TaxID=153721 RepID=A0A098L9F5_9BACT|nr:glycosyltransferase N-terminal domain-containing protein [Sporocytophaga myxococcoides]GAL83004.1 3-deoxy-D-manno-octulosonic acid transferase [Sporocytophaga myxococcoides]